MKLLESYWEERMTTTIKRLIKNYRLTNHCSIKQINQGHCDGFCFGC